MAISEQALLHLRDYPLFKGLSEAELQVLQEILTEKEYQKEEEVAKAEEALTGFYLLVTHLTH